MKPQNHQNAQDDIESIAFDAWLSSPEGQAWLDDDEERAGSWWNHDGFNPEICGHA